VTPCSLVSRCFDPADEDSMFSPNRWFIPARLRGVTSRNNNIVMWQNAVMLMRTCGPVQCTTLLLVCVKVYFVPATNEHEDTKKASEVPGPYTRHLLPFFFLASNDTTKSFLHFGGFLVCFICIFMCGSFTDVVGSDISVSNDRMISE
jgi:hypothetical protein